MSALVRLDRLLSELGIGSRSEVAALIRTGAVEVAGAVLRSPAERVEASLPLRVRGEPVDRPPVGLVYHKPVGVLVTMDDPWGRATVASVLGPRLSAALHPVGRLDADTSGLLLFLADGQLTQRLLHPRRRVEKEYLATVDAPPPSDLAARLTEGVRTAEGVHVAHLVSATEDQVRLVVTEGKHRMVRRMLANLGLPVRELVRLRFGAIALGAQPPGTLRPFAEAEWTWLTGQLPHPPPHPRDRAVD